MTATVERPTGVPDPPVRRPAPSAATVPTAPDRAAEGTLLLVTGVATLAFGRLFTSFGIVVPLLVAAVGAHLVAAVARRRRWGVGATLGAAVAGFVLQTSVTLYPHTSFAGLPTAATLGAIDADVDRAWELFGTVTAPAPVARGFLLAVTLALWVAVTLADWAAFRIRTTAEAVLPALALFTFTAILADGPAAVPLAATLAVAVLGFAVAQRARHAARRDAWIGGRAAAGVATLVRVGAVVAVVCGVLAAVAGPRLPGAQAAALVDLTGGDGPSRRVTVSPLVDIRSRLVEQSESVVFEVRSPRSAYWRLTSLDRFDGQVWSSSGSFPEADGALPSPPPGATTATVEQTFTIASLGTIWAPAALTPVDLQASDAPLRWNADLTTLIVPSARESIDGVTYTVTSEVPELTPEDLEAELEDPLPTFLAEATRLPDSVTPLVASQAREVVQGAGSSPYAQARALQDWFRGTFTYDLQGTGSGHGRDAIEAFIAARRGYCEQFAGTFAAMARSLGLPARVAVGFTPGEVDEEGTTYTVRGRNAHAWPEVHIPGVGWVPFEPTPGRGQPGTEAYTGVAPAQDQLDGEPGATTTTTTPSPSVPPGPATTSPDDPGVRSGPGVTAADPTDGDRSTGAGRALVVLVGLLAGAVLVDVAGLAVVRARRRRRWRASTAEVGRIRAAWAEVVAALAAAGTAPAPAETDDELAARLAPGLGPAGPALLRLAGLATRATWAPDDDRTGPPRAGEAEGLASEVIDRVRADRSRGQRLRALIDPRLTLSVG